MSTEHRRKRRRITPAVRFLLSAAAVLLLLYFAGFAFRYCLGLFVADEAYLVRLPGTDPIAQIEPESDPNAGSNTVTQTGRATILAAGDLMTHLPIVRSGQAGNDYNFSYIFNYVKPYVSSADYAVVNLETTLSGTDGLKYTGYPKFNAPDAIAAGVYSSGFDMVLTANNRCYDYGTAGLLRTLEVARAAGLETLGTSSNVEDPKYTVKELNGIKVGMISYTFADIVDDRNTPIIDGTQTDSKAAGLVNIFDYANLDIFYAEMENHISGMRASGAEAIVLFIHWGDEFSVKPSSTQKIIAQKMCDLGVDVIAGSHPHVIQPIEQLTSTDGTNRTLCLYSLGNFLSNQRADNIALESGHSEDGLMFSFTFVKYSNGQVHVESVDLLPTWVMIRGEDDNKTFHILPLDTKVEDWNSTFSISGSMLDAASDSLERTKALIDPSLTEVKAALEQQNAERSQALGTFTGGVG